ncbi:MAG: L-seryl-tRNA(Sec) selenium transferase [Isosphaeraceae bacterium]
MSDPRLRALPAVHRLIDDDHLTLLRERYGRETVARAARIILDKLRERLQAPGGNPEAVDVSLAAIVASVADLVERPRLGLRPVLNATGILLHTGLGRAPLAPEAIEAIRAVASGYCNLEIELATGQRGRRTSSVASLLRDLTGAEAATVVNNNAGATVIALRALAFGREVIVARGQLIEIGGSFRLPEIFEVSGASLREVGTTNRTRLADYERAITAETAALLRVHPSNYRVVGFTESVEIAPLAALARSRGLAVIDDLGSGAIAPGLPPVAVGEPTFAESLNANVDLALGSGDKLLGGPQCGILLGTQAAIARVESDPLMRALRVDKLKLAALEATLRLALDPQRGRARIPLWSFLTTEVSTLHERAERLSATLCRVGLAAKPVPSRAAIGGGSVPGEEIPSAAVRIGPPWPGECRTVDEWAGTLRLGVPSVVGRVQEGALLFDLRAIDPADDDRLADAIMGAGRTPGGVVA